MKRIYTSIDVGSNTIKVLVVEWYRGRANVLAVSEVPSVGIKKGLVVNAEEAGNAILKAIKDVEDRLNLKINKAIVTVPSNNAEYKIVSTELSIDNEERKVSENDIINIFKSAISKNIVKDRELVSVLPIKFEIDGENCTNNPIGSITNKIKLIGMLVTVPSKNVQSVTSLLASINISVVDIATSSICDYYCYKDEFIKDKIGSIINIGEEVTNIGIITKGIITESSIIQMGAGNVDNDLTYLFKLPNKNKEIKEMFAIAHKRYANSAEIKEYVNSDGKKIRINQYEVSEIVMDRLAEILEVAKKEINDLTNSEISYIIITGGISNIIGLKFLGNEIFGKKFLNKSISTIGIRNNKYSTVLGNIYYFADKLKLRGKRYSMISDEEESKLLIQKKQINSGDSVLSKIFGYFFEN